MKENPDRKKKRIALEYVKAISRPTKINMGLQSILLKSIKIIAIFFSFCLFKLLIKFMVMPPEAATGGVVKKRCS